MGSQTLTVDEPDGSHGDGEEAVFVHWHFDQNCGENKEQQDEEQAAGDADGLCYPGSRKEPVQVPGPSWRSDRVTDDL